jgi:hypothetical protein
MTDRELLEMSALAAGVEYQRTDDGDVIEYFGGGLQLAFGGGKWNPLTEDGDALSLAVTLGICIRFIFHRPERKRTQRGCIAQRYEFEAEEWAANHSGDISMAVRRAIVLVASAVGRQDDAENKVRSDELFEHVQRVCGGISQ